jgi:hypothetical protein
MAKPGNKIKDSRRNIRRFVWIILLAVACAFGESHANEVRLGKLRISENGRHSIREDGSAFIWIGDTSWHVYFTVFAGAAGHTYGAQGVWDKQIDSTKTWRKALELPGARQVGYLGRLLGSRPVLTRIPYQSLILSGQLDEYESHVQATRCSEGGYAFVYIADGHRICVDLAKLSSQKIRAAWFNPRDGSSISIGEFQNAGHRSFNPPGDAGAGNNWVLILDAI